MKYAIGLRTRLDGEKLDCDAKSVNPMKIEIIIQLQPDEKIALFAFGHEYIPF